MAMLWRRDVKTTVQESQWCPVAMLVEVEQPEELGHQHAQEVKPGNQLEADQKKDLAWGTHIMQQP